MKNDKCLNVQAEICEMFICLSYVLTVKSSLKPQLTLFFSAFKLKNLTFIVTDIKLPYRPALDSVLSTV